MKQMVVLAAACAVAGCLGTGPGEPSLGGDAARPAYRVNGVAYDSLAVMPIPDLDLRVGATRLRTDAYGRFSADVDSGYVTFQIFTPDYEPPHLAIPHIKRQFVTLRLRRYAPLVVAFQVLGDSVQATIVDLQGRKTIDRWLVSRVTLHRPVGSSIVLGTGMNWRVVDDFTYQARVAAAGIDSATWDVHDVTGFSVVSDCDLTGHCTVLRSGFQGGVGR